MYELKHGINAAERATSREATGRLDSRRGIALLTVLSALAVLTVVATDMQYNARVDAQLAENGRDELIAYYNARNALEIELGILRAVRQAQATISQLIPGLPLPTVLNMIPVECGLIGQFFTLSDDTPLPLVGECSAKAEAEKGKIDVNQLASVSMKFNVRNLLLGRLMDPRFDRYWEEEHGNGERVSRDELIGAFGDYVDLDNVRDGSSVGDEDDNYARMKDRYKVKNAPFDSVAEMQLIFGVDDALFAELQRGLTVYPVGGISLVSADLATIAAVIRQAAVNPADPAFYSEPMLLLLQQIVEMRAIPLGGAILNATALVGLARALGMVLDEPTLKKFVDDRQAMDWYTVVATGQQNSVEKRIRATFNLAANQMVYFREE